MQTSVEPAVPAPSVPVGMTDHGLISEVARRWPRGGKAAIGALLSKLEKAAVAPDDELPPDVARLCSVVELGEWPGGKSRCVQLVLPQQVDLGDRRIAVTSPLGAALLGAREGERIRVGYHADREHVITVLSVRQRHADRGRLGADGRSGEGARQGLRGPTLTVSGGDPY